MVCLFCSIIAVIAAMYCLFDVNYFIRAGFTTIWRKIIPRKRKRISEEVHTYGFSTTNDIDFVMGQMNNARFLRELDFSRLDYYHRTGLYDTVVSRRGSVVQGATAARYRKPMPIFTFYQVTTKLLYWEERAVYLEHKFISVSDNFVRAVIISKQNVLGMDMTVTEIIKIVDPEMQRPELPEDLEHWINFINASSQKLKKID